jgi:hypothetical protein
VQPPRLLGRRAPTVGALLTLSVAYGNVAGVERGDVLPLRNCSTLAAFENSFAMSRPRPNAIVATFRGPTERPQVMAVRLML